MDPINIFLRNPGVLHKALDCTSPELGALEFLTVLEWVSEKGLCLPLTGRPVLIQMKIRGHFLIRWLKFK